MRGRRGRRNWDAFDEFCARVYPRLVGTVALVAGNAELAADAVCEGLARAWKRHQRGEDVELLESYVRVVALRIVREHRHDASVRPKQFASKHSRVSSSLEPDRELSLDVRNALTSLPARPREVIVLHLICDLSIDAIAAELGTASGAVESSLERARAQLGDVLRKQSQAVNHDAS